MYGMGANGGDALEQVMVQISHRFSKLGKSPGHAEAGFDASSNEGLYPTSDICVGKASPGQ